MTFHSLEHMLTEARIYKRKHESEKASKHAFDQEIDQEKKKERKHTLDQESDQEKKKKLSFFLERFLGLFLGRERVFFLFFLNFLFSFINSHFCGRYLKILVMHIIS